MRRNSTSYSHFTTVCSLLLFSLPLLGEQGALPHGISPDWYHRAVATIEDKEYAIRTMDAPGIYAAVNHDQHLGYWFSAEGYGVQNFNEDGSTKGLWKEQFLFAGIGRGQQLRQVGAAAISRPDDHRIGFDYGGYSLVYDHEKQGMEQSFVIYRRPSGSKPLSIALQLAGDLAASVKDDALRLSAGNAPDTRLVYDQLTVWDSHHRQLPAHMRLDGSRRLVLSIDDSKAVYPVTVDPFSHGASITYTVQNILNSGITDASAHTVFGYSVAGSDVNKDGFSDIVIGAPTFANISAITAAHSGTATLTTTITGAAFVYYGGNNGPGTSPSKVLQPGGLSVGALFGFSVSAIGTAGGTGSGIMVGAPGQQQTITYVGSPQAIPVGAVYVFYGSSSVFNASITSEPAANVVLTLAPTDFTSTVAPPTRNPLFGWSIADAGDINGDGYDEIIVGSPNYAESPLVLGTSASGRIDIFNGSASGVAATHSTTTYGLLTGELFGFSVNTAGHVDGDATHAGIIVGAPGNVLTGSIIRGRAYVFYGASGGITSVSDAAASGTVGMTIIEPNPLSATLFGFSVSTAGDVDNDGHDDMIIGAPLSPTGTFGSEAAIGKAYIYYGGTLSGGSLVPSRASVTLTSPRATSKLNFLFGWSVANVGNVTGDAAADVAIGEPGSLAVSASAIGTYLTALGISSTLQSNSGQAYVFAGSSGASISTSPILTVNDPSTPNELGYSVRGAGDVDGDGHPDFMIGEPGGSLDLSFNIASLAGQLSGPTSTAGTLTIGTGLLASNSVGNALLYFGFNGTLPLSMTSFTGEAQGNQTLLNWTTAQEENTNDFQVQRSLDGQNYTTIGTVTAAHNSVVQTNYSFVDPSPATGNDYYRLNMVDMDGQSTYSNIVLVNFNSTAGQQITVYPNPAHGSFQLLFQNMPAGRYGMDLINSSGQIVLMKFIQVASGASYNQMIELGSNLTAGTYFVRIVDSQNKSYITRIVIE
jgi:hypothetical protein